MRSRRTHAHQERDPAKVAAYEHENCEHASQGKAGERTHGISRKVATRDVGA